LIVHVFGVINTPTAFGKGDPHQGGRPLMGWAGKDIFGMFQARRNKSTIGLMFNLAEVMYISTVRKVRQAHGNAILSIGLSLFQSALFLAAFYLMFSFMGGRSSAIGAIS